jgi:hypothetical protein
MYVILVGTGFSTQCYGTFETIGKAKDWAKENFPMQHCLVLILRQP